MNRRHVIAAMLTPTQGAARVESIEFDLVGARATLEIAGEHDTEFGALVQAWLEKSAHAVHCYYGKFPVPEIAFQIKLQDGQGVAGGQTYSEEVPLIRVRVGTSSTAQDFLIKDWVMVHEMVHLAFPWMNLRHNWMAEGTAVYVESIARVHAGHLAPAQVWADFVKMMPRGLPQAGDGGFEVTVNWGRTYWGGAMFCLIADVRIRRETENAFGLQHALRAINATRDFRNEWDFRETLALGDSATGSSVLVSQFDEMKETPVSPDLDLLWSDLGVVSEGVSLSFNDAAPLASVRRSIEAKLT